MRTVVSLVVEVVVEESKFVRANRWWPNGTDLPGCKYTVWEIMQRH